MTLKKLLLALIVVVGSVFIPPSLIPTPFELRVVDEQTGVGVPVRVTTDSGIGRETPNGYLYWWAPCLMSRDVRFGIADAANQFDAASLIVRVTHGGRATVRLHRRT